MNHRKKKTNELLILWTAFQVAFVMISPFHPNGLFLYSPKKKQKKKTNKQKKQNQTKCFQGV